MNATSPPPSAGGSAIVIGAGLAGLTAALALQRSGWRVRVYEQAPVLGEVGAGITLSPGAGRGLASLGIEAELLAASLPVPDIAFVHYRTGKLLAGVLDDGAPPDFGFDKARHIHRADLHAILVAAVRRLDPDAVVTAKRLVEVEPDASGVAARFADGGTATADILIGADGSRSMVRRLMFEDSPPEFAGQVAYRCLIPNAVAAPYMRGGNAVVSIGASRIFNRYLIRGGALVNVIGIAKSGRWREEGWNTPATVDEFLSEYEGFHDGVTDLIRLSPASTLIKWGLFVRPPLSRWHTGRVVLIGDAAHPILPFLGLGAALAIEDGIVLARALGLTGDPEAAFQAFQRSRLDRVETVRTQSILQGEIIQASDPDAKGVTASPSQNLDLFSYDPCNVPIQVGTAAQN
jgi:salicylate hydroxylase